MRTLEKLGYYYYYYYNFISFLRQVDKAAFFNNEFDKEFLLGNTFAHKSQQDSRSNN